MLFNLWRNLWRVLKTYTKKFPVWELWKRLCKRIFCLRNPWLTHTGEDGSAPTVASVEGQNGLFQLFDFLRFSGAVIQKPLPAGIQSLIQTAQADILGFKALGFVFKHPEVTEDLVEASKASSGSIQVNKELLNIGELINQSIGEFSEKLEAANIIPVVNLPEEETFVFTDGRLLWRVFDNLIQNIIKYAQPGTRAYFDLSGADKKAVLTIKNISKEPLNMTAEALMERFVRGDESRNSEGNGLGLSIAKSLTELCGGSFSLALDGDLYKVKISFPETEN